MGRQTITTTTREYDADGRLVTETVTETVHEWADQPATVDPVPLVAPYVPWQPQPLVTPWQYPSITCAQAIGQPEPNVHVTINSTADPAAVADEIGRALRFQPQ